MVAWNATVGWLLFADVFQYNGNESENGSESDWNMPVCLNCGSNNEQEDFNYAHE